LTGPFAKIIVGAGDSAVVFNLIKELLCNSSTYFKAVLNNGFSETTTQKIMLDDDPDVFRTYAAWLFEHGITHEGLKGIVGDLARHFFHVYIFADKRGITGLADDVVTMLASFWTCDIVDMNLTLECLQLFSPHSTLYQLVLDSLILDMRASWWDEDCWNVLCLQSHDVVVELLKKERAFPAHFDSHSHCIETICHYHRHSDEIEQNECIKKIERGFNLFTLERHPEKQIKWRW
jgi:hypothetical protein